MFTMLGVDMFDFLHDERYLPCYPEKWIEMELDRLREFENWDGSEIDT